VGESLYFLTGIGSGLANVPMMVLVSHWFTKAKRGQAAGIMLAGNGLAIIFAGMLVPLLNRILGADGWRSGWRILGAISAGIAITAGLLFPRGTRQARGSWFTSVSCTFSSDSRT
jgi:MFS family permease